MTDDLVAFLRARLDEDERAALGTLDPLTVIGRHRGKTEQRWRVTESGRGIIDADGGRLRARDVFPAEAEHIARHDPTRVLAEVDAKRRILDEVVPEVAGLEARIDGEWGVGTVTTDGADDMLLRLLALPYANHPDYQTEWAPEA